MVQAGVQEHLVQDHIVLDHIKIEPYGPGA